MKRTFFFFAVSSRRSCRLSIEPFNLSISGWGIDLDYCEDEWFGMEINQDHPVTFEIAPKFQTFVDYEGYSISSKGFLPTVVDKMAI